MSLVRRMRDYDPFWDIDPFFSPSMMAPSLMTPSLMTPSWSLTSPFRDISTMRTFPAIDMRETDKNYIVEAELPGLNKENIKVDIRNNMLNIEGEQSEERKEGEEGGTYYMRERRYGKFCRRIRLPENADQKNVKAQYKNGILEVTIPKSEGTGHHQKITVG